jgi:hypothetical protein
VLKGAAVGRPLFCRLETSVSEDLGIDGLAGLWLEHNAVLIRHGFALDCQPVLNGSGH